jgi:CubicO group peptidase (beta-lactamase class C family)
VTTDLTSVARRVVEHHGAAPCAVVAAAVREPGSETGWRVGSGAAGRLWPDPAAPPATCDTLFDLASVSKPVTALLLARAERAGWLERARPLGEALVELAASPSASISLDVLSSHRAGLEAHIEFFIKRADATQRNPEDIYPQAASARRAGCSGALPEQGFAPVYSDLGYILVGAALERAGKAPLDALVSREVAAPLGLRLGSVRSLGADEPPLVAAVAPTEVVPWRGGMLRAVVHDENAWVLAGRGSAGHAGLFGDARAVLGVGQAVLDALADRGDWLSSRQLAPLIRRRPGGSHCAGFDRRSQPDDGSVPMSGRHFGPETFGHLGFTGTSLWIDPERELCGVLLTNRVHPTREHIAIRKARPDAYDGIFEAMI